MEINFFFSNYIVYVWSLNEVIKDRDHLKYAVSNQPEQNSLTSSVVLCDYLKKIENLLQKSEAMAMLSSRQQNMKDAIEKIHT